MKGGSLEVVNRVVCIRVKIGNYGRRRQKQPENKAIWNHTLETIDKCLTRSQNIKIDMLENIYGVICEKRVLCGTEIWGINGMRNKEYVKNSYKCCQRDGWKWSGKIKKEREVTEFVAKHWAGVKQSEEENRWAVLRMAVGQPNVGVWLEG